MKHNTCPPCSGNCDQGRACPGAKDAGVEPALASEPQSRESFTHIIQVWPSFYGALIDGSRTFEVRRDDREGGFQVGDSLLLYEWDPASQEDTGRVCRRVIGYVMRSGGEVPGIERGYVVLSLKDGQ